jgi:hypothetical protein
MLADFAFFVEELGALLAEFLAATVLELEDGRDEESFVFHGVPPPDSA